MQANHFLKEISDNLLEVNHMQQCSLLYTYRHIHYPHDAF
jgi:hypothetical protein